MGNRGSPTRTVSPRHRPGATNAQVGSDLVAERRLCRRASAAAFHNAEALYRDARVLLRHRRYSRAAALAIIGCEEVGKALALAFAGIGRVPDVHLQKLLRDLRYGGRSHQSKQAISLVAWLLGDMLGRLRPAVYRTLRPRVRQLKVPASFGEFVTLLTGEMEKLVPVLRRIVEGRAGDWSELNKAADDVASGSWQRVRDRALYVDLHDEELHEPTDISRSEAVRHVSRLQVALRGFRPLRPVSELSDKAVAALHGELPDLETVDRFWREAARRPSRRLAARSKPHHHDRAKRR